MVWKDPGGYGKFGWSGPAGVSFQIESSYNNGRLQRAPQAVRAAAWRLGFVVLGLALGLCVAEPLLRLLDLGRPGLYTYDRDRGWVLRPNARGWQDKEGKAYVMVNSAGLRDREHPERKPPHTLRIAILGDSFTEAKQVPLEQTFCAVIERRLKSCPALAGRDVETLNFGVDSYGTAQELMTLRRQAWKFSPDVVVLAVCTGNDIRNDSIELEGDKCQPFFTYRDGELVLSG
ncbi:MAG TPA: SGNH/GDSL hydrolase family protein, partial [Candidatus Binataceae bacterium]|nr:SGNH/GDSL hydrolase family protein [Candidatus Binataceae bacterium]